MPRWIVCPTCGGFGAKEGPCTHCGAPPFEPPPRWERVLMGIAAAIVIAANCAAVPFYLVFILGLVLRQLWLRPCRGNRP